MVNFQKFLNYFSGLHKAESFDWSFVREKWLQILS